MSVTAVPSVSYLPIEWAGAVVPEGDAQAFGLAINDAGKILDQGLTSVESTLGAPGPATAVDASSLGLQVQGLAQVTPGLLSGAGLIASSEDEWPADQDIQAAAAPNVPAQMQAAATTTEVGDALISAGSEPMRFRAADDMPLPPQLGSRSATPAMPPRGRGTEAEVESELPQQMGSAAQELLGEPAQLLAAAPNVQSASRVAADKPPVASDGNAAASDIAVPDGALAPRADNVAVTGQQRPIEASGFAASMPDNQAGAAHAGVSRQDANVTNTDRSSSPVPTPPAALPTAPALQTSKGLGKGLALEMRKSIEDGREHMRVRLDPKELGQLDVRLSFEKDGALRAIITASTSASNDLLRQELPTLVRNLSGAGVRMDEGSLRFELQSGSGGGSGQRQTPQEERRTPSRNGAWEDLRPEEDTVFGTRPRSARGQFDLRA
ncbi:flagellar hook-length control protein FliK [Sphingorhabdus sp. EL138]|uniref:flagellar hook-length control protein FliK n=1 Tax=Sphingorhabdus sp. EL138 TaxID=2073156 RepID=UPI0025FE91F6|nr:flagellar hook-length control protein FliK [Sphingorhabdus sp. EL138]